MRKQIILSAVLALAMCCGAQAQMAQAPQASVTERVQSFQTLQTVWTNGLEQLQQANDAQAVHDAVLDFFKKSLPLNKMFNSLTDYQKNQIGVLQKRYGTLMQAKNETYNCKELTDAAIQEATMSMLTSMGTN